MGHLIACPGCARHARAEDPLCPFCGEALPASLRARVPRAPTERLGRAATFVFGATLAASAATGCDGGSQSDAGASGSDAGYDAGNVAPPYGLPPPDGGDDAGYDAGNVAPPYGLPPPDDAGPEPDAGASDAGFDAGNVDPPYGLPPPDDDGGVAPLYGGTPGT